MPLSKVPDHVQKAMLAAEDRDFYQNNGISPTGIARAVWRGQGRPATQGGVDDHPAVREELLPHVRPHADAQVKEILISVKIDQQQGKDQILENYLNTIYYGRGAYGIQTASKAYFNKDVCAADASPRAPSSPRSSARRRSTTRRSATSRRPTLKERVSFILDAMVEKGWLTPGRPRQGHRPRRESRRNKPRTRAARTATSPRWSKTSWSARTRSRDSDLDRGGLRIVYDDRQGQAGRHGRRSQA